MRPHGQPSSSDSNLSYDGAALNRIFQLCPVALALSTIDEGRMVDVNERWLAMFGYRKDEVIGRTNAELRLNVEPARRDEVVRQARVTGIVRDAEVKVRTKAGQTRDVIISALPFEAEGIGEVWLSACVEITDRKYAEAERDQLLAREQIARAEAEQAIEKLRAVYAITERIEPPGEIGELLVEVLRRLRRTLQIDDASVMLLDDEGKSLYLRATEGPEPRQAPVPDVRVPIGYGVSGKILAEGRPMIVDDYSAIDGSAFASFQNIQQTTQSVMGVPFRIGERVAGVVVVSTRTRRKFTGEELRLLLLAADRVGPAIERGRLIERIRTGMERRRSLSRRLLTAQEEERRRIAVELHDELGQILTAVKINLESIERSPSANTLARLPAMIASVDDALQRIKDIALDLRPSVLDDLGLEAALRWFADRSARNAGIAAHLSIDALPPLEPNLQTACFRVMQEALTNVDRHAKARGVWIDLHVLDGALELSVRDDGIGFDVAAAKARAIAGNSVGILGMQERVALMGGEYDIVRIPNGGTEVRARFPLSSMEAQ
jgi:PAS domain S-box-containing protein